MLLHRSVATRKRRTRCRHFCTALAFLYNLALLLHSANGSASRHQLPPPPPPRHQHYGTSNASLKTNPLPQPDHKPEQPSEDYQDSSLSQENQMQNPPPPPNDTAHSDTIAIEQRGLAERETTIAKPKQEKEQASVLEMRNYSSPTIQTNDRKMPPPPPPPQRASLSGEAIIREQVSNRESSVDSTKQDAVSQLVPSPPIRDPGQIRGVGLSGNLQQTSHTPQEQQLHQHLPPHEARPSFPQLRHLQQHRQEMQQKYQPNKVRWANQLPQGQAKSRLLAQNRRGLYTPPRQHAYEQPPSRQSASASSGLLKSLWSRVERGLDGLADVEEIVADRAKGIGNAIATRTTTLVARRSQVPPSNPPPQPIAHSPVRNYKKDDVEKPSENANKKLIGSFGAKYKNVKAGSLKKQNEEKYEHLKTQSRKLDWNSIASGGRQVVGGDLSRRSLNNVSSPPGSWYPQQQEQQQQTHAPKPASSVATKSQPRRQARSSVTPSPFPVQDDSDDDDDGNRGGQSLVSRIPLPSFPRLPSPIMRLLGKGSGSFHRTSKAAMDQWTDSETSMRRSRRLRPTMKASIVQPTAVVPDPVADLLKRSSKQPGGLLTSRDTSKAKFIGQQQATFDIAFLLFSLFGVHQLFPFFSSIHLRGPASFSVLFSTTLPELSAALLKGLQDSWALYAVAGAFLTTASRIIVVDGRMDWLANSVGRSIERLTRYSQFYMRLVASIPIDRRSQRQMRDASEREVLDLVAASRLQNFVAAIVVAMLMMTVPVVRPVFEALWTGINQAVTMEGWRSWPLKYRELAVGMKSIVVTQFQTIVSLVSAELPKALENPMLVLFQVATVGALLILTVPPAVARRRKASKPQNDDDDDDEDEYLSRTAESLRGTLNNLGASSATRLSVLSKKGAAGSALERWWSAVPPTDASSRSFSPLALLRHVGYGLAAAVLAASPAVVYFLAVSPNGIHCCPAGLFPLLQWDSIVDVSVLMLLAATLSWKATISGLSISEASPYSIDFMGRVDSLTREVANDADQPAQTQFGSSLVPTKGLSVRDLWASHAFVSAWAVRGANLDCASGEVVLVLGDEGSGKTRLLTAVAESIITPPRAALTTTKVRGNVSVCGIDVNKWDQRLLKRRLGLFLSDVRSQSDVAELFAGTTVEEILEPLVSSARSQSNVVAKRSAISQAMKITGLASTLQRFPAKLGAIVSPNEDEVVPTDARPPRYLLTPAEWSKLLLTRMLAQAIHDNDNISADSWLLGSILVLDDVLSWMNEVDEARLIQKLRSSGAASILTSHKWATGRFADRIVVVKDGAVVESGTHTELLNRGPQASLYAAKWLAMSQS